MKRLFLLLPLLFIAGCGKYGSYAEAFEACTFWTLEKDNAFGIADSADSEGGKFTPIRMCTTEHVTSQVLGYEYPKAEAFTTYTFNASRTKYVNENGKVLESRVIAKRFKY